MLVLNPFFFYIDLKYLSVDPVLLVGDSLGAAHTFKLSPNLRFISRAVLSRSNKDRKKNRFYKYFNWKFKKLSQMAKKL